MTQKQANVLSLFFVLVGLIAVDLITADTVYRMERLCPLRVTVANPTTVPRPWERRR